MSQDSYATLAGNPVHMIRPHLRDVPEVGLPKGYAIRQLRVEEGAVWTDVVLDAEPWLELSKELFTNEFAHDLSSVPERCRSYHRVWWALHGWSISNGWRLRKMHEYEEAQSDDSCACP